MEQQKLWIAVAVAMAMMVLPFHCLATDYTVGDSAQWNLGVNYSTWASGKTFAVGDKLVFKYAVGSHDTLVVNKAAYDSCLITNPLSSHTSGNDTITLDSTGTTYYICGIGNHCSSGMKLAVTVGAASPQSPPTTSSPVSSPPPPDSTGSPPNNSAATASYRMDGVVLGASLLFAMVLL